MSQQQGLRILIAEDDAAQRQALAQWVGELQPEWRVVAAVDSVAAFTQALDEQAPDLLLVDIHLPGAPSADWIKSLDSRVPVIYVTGDPEFAVHAFDSDAVDYVLKPITLRRLKVALERAAADPRLSRKAPAFAGPTPIGAADAAVKWITMSRGTEVLVVNPEEILFLEADLKYTRVVTTRGEGLVRTGLNELCEKFADPRFVKIHRGTVVNLRYVASVRRSELGHLDVHLRGHEDVLRVSKSFQHVFRSF